MALKSSETPRLRNSVSVESPYGLRSFALRVGSICDAPDPVLVVPTHANPRFELDGQVVDAVTSRYSVDFSVLEPLLTPRDGFGTYRVPNRGSFRGQEVLVVRIPGARSVEESGGQPIVAYAEALWTLFGSLAALELRGSDLKSMALPLLAATRGYSISELVRAILEHSLRWLKCSRFMHAVNFYLFDSQESTQIEAWTTAMDDVLGRKLVDSAQNHLIGALRDEILARLSESRFNAFPDNWQVCLGALHDSLKQQKIPLERVATDARRFVECIVVNLLTEQGVAQPKGSLDESIKELRQRKKTAPWIISHFDCLRVFGNAGVHLAVDSSFQPAALRDEDLIAILASLQRVLAFAESHE